MKENVLYYGDNLDILRRYIKNETIDLIYLDPPFKSEQDYNVLFAEQNGSRAAAQIKAFEDTWQWDQASAAAYQEVVESGPQRVSQVMQGFWTSLGASDMMAYLAMMAPRLLELHRVLKSTGSIYLHCDPTASHYLKMLMDAVFGPIMFKNEIVWQRFKFHADARRFGRVSDRILFYSKSDSFIFNRLRRPFSDSYVSAKFTHTDPDGRLFRLSDLNPPGGRGPIYKFHGVTRPWRFSKEKMLELEKEGRIYTKSRVAQLKRYLDELEGQAVHEIWDDISPINPMAKERLGYQTQKPEALLERTIMASSKEGDTVLDPFCGCGTAIAVAQRLKRRWIGIDITQAAMVVIKKRLRDSFGDKVDYKIIGEPVSLPDAQALANRNPYQFQWWALGLVGARPVEQKKGADKGIDGRLYFHDEAENKKTKTKQIILSVKAGQTGPGHVRDLRGVIEREKAEIGVFICMQKATKTMRAEAASAGFYKSPWGTKHATMQILTVEELLSGKTVDYPHSEGVNVTFNKAPKAKGKKEAHPELKYPEE